MIFKLFHFHYQVGEITRSGRAEIPLSSRSDRGSVGSAMSLEGSSDDGSYGVGFPVDLEVRIKATLLGALFLIDFLFFEK